MQILIDLEKFYDENNVGTQHAVSLLIEEGIRQVICRHCEDSACVSACPQKALKKGTNAPVKGAATELLAKEGEDLKRASFLCTGCRTCIIACPFGVNIDEIVGYKRWIENWKIIRLKIKEYPYIEEGEFEESEDIIKIAEGVFVKGTNWKKQIGIKQNGEIRMTNDENRK